MNIEKLGDKKRHAIKPDAQPFDEIRIITVPRYKTSGLSGNEWRISGQIKLMRKGKIIHERSMGNIENCVHALSMILMEAKDSALGFYGGGEDNKCDQEGCSELATTFYRVKQEFCNEPHKHQPIELSDEIVIRQFCERHSTRGDCSFDDADANYELIDGKIDYPSASDIKPSVFGGIINVEEKL